MKTPLRIAAWFVEHLTEGLAGDLEEEFRNGRSAAWYRRQAILAILSSLFAAFRRGWLYGFLAFLWAIAADLLENGVLRYTHWWIPMPWPWSLVSEISAHAAVHFCLAAAGLFLVLLPSVRFRVSRFPPRARAALLLLLAGEIAIVAALQTATLPMFSGAADPFLCFLAALLSVPGAVPPRSLVGDGAVSQ